ncbi:hypothetical protein pdam_00002635 [Pocillopora damicornis]|uniref:Uncharacterized protein n=1 Tax=Pocillopora damicornis TaxID=46731 RepID=A0A3M6U371_POCDA|nr:hypothetical protein pdam_00002635 [Pocillopora damicornis]
MVSYPQWTWLYIIMNIGNELYSGLSRQSYLLSTEVPEMIIAFNINYQFQCNPSYTGTIHCTCEVQDFNYCITRVGFYCSEGKFKILILKVEIYGMPHTQGTCVLLEVNTLNELINYFHGLYQNPNVLFELKGEPTNEKQCDMTDISDQQLSAVPLKQIMQMLKLEPFIFPCYAVVPHLFIAFVFPSSNITLDRITDHANKLYREKLYGDNHRLTINNFPKTLQIYDADINIAFNLEKQGILCCTSPGSKLLLQKLITDNTKDNTGF